MPELRQSFVVATCFSLFCGVDVNAQLEIVNIRVGQGDATLIQGPPDALGNRVNVLFDGGDLPEGGGVFDGGNILRTVLNKRGITTFDYLVVSHYDADHIGGIVSGENHGLSFLLGFNGTPGVGDDDGDGDDGWVGDEFYTPDPEELGQDDDIRVAQFVDRGDVPRILRKRTRSTSSCGGPQ